MELLIDFVQSLLDEITSLKSMADLSATKRRLFGILFQTQILQYRLSDPKERAKAKSIIQMVPEV